jgi:glyoxylase-like metal-dependent hydrolase (beta-lactamase superfamily II)
VDHFLCATCGTQFPASEVAPEACPVCEDVRQYVPADGQRWTTLEELRSTHRAEIRDELPGLLGIGCKPEFAIGQRPLLVPTERGNVLWDCQALLNEEIVSAVRERGGLEAIAISHPHYYSTMVEWAHAFDCPILIHEDDREWVMRPDPSVGVWSGDVRELAPGVTLLRLGGHFAGGQVLHWAERKLLLSGDIVQVIPDRRFVSFMYSYPNLIPLPPDTVDEIARGLEPWDYDTIVGAWWGRIVQDGKEAVRRSARRYRDAVEGRLGP